MHIRASAPLKHEFMYLLVAALPYCGALTGAELLARYCTGGGADDSFWGVIRTNIRQYNYIRSLQLQVEVRMPVSHRQLALLIVP